MKLRNLTIVPGARLVRSERLDRPAGHFRAEIAVMGMVCSRWARRVKRALEGLHGTTDVTVSLAEERAVVTYDSNALAVSKLIDAVQRSVLFPGLRRAIGRPPHAAGGQSAS